MDAPLAYCTTTTSAVPALRSDERALLLCLAETVIPRGAALPAADGRTVDEAARLVDAGNPKALAAWVALARSVDAMARLSRLKSFPSLTLEHRLALLERWQSTEGSAVLLRALLTPLKLAYFDADRAYAALGLRHSVERPAGLERERWQANVTAAESYGGDVELECDVVVVGTGAGGAPVAATLAERGFAVLLLEEGALRGRGDFDGRPLPSFARMYRRGGLTPALGNGLILVPTGKGVGGTTTINAGTCLRAPPYVLDGWRERLGIDVDADTLEPFYQRVERFLDVGPSDARALGRPAVVMARGAEALGWSHGPLPRNAPGCDGQGVCCFGCPTAAKRSTDVSYVPAALRAGAQLVTGVRVERVEVQADVATGVVASARTKDGAPMTVRVRASAVVLACGTLHTPALLLRQGIANASGQLGRNLTIHPATSAFGRFDELIDGHAAVPQGYAVDEHAREGILIEGASTPPELVAASLRSFGPAFLEVMERYRQLLGVGFMIADSSKGRVRASREGTPIVTYRVNEQDTLQLRRGMELVCRMLFAAGALEVFSPVASLARLSSAREAEAFRSATIPARAFDLTAYHPLGTARMGPDPASSVLLPTHEAHDVMNLYVVDGAAVSGPLHANPQLTIMAMSLRAADSIALRLERLQRQERKRGLAATVS